MGIVSAEGNDTDLSPISVVLMADRFLHVEKHPVRINADRILTMK
jgi:hypothetical protein